MKAEYLFALVGLLVLIVALGRFRAGRGGGELRGFGFKVKAESNDQTSLDVSNISAGRDVNLEAEKILATDIQAGRDFAARPGSAPVMDPVAKTKQ